jgi:uncharacterized membrane protein YccC
MVQESCLVQHQKVQQLKDLMEQECNKIRAAGEQHQQQLDMMRKQIEAADNKLEEEEQRRLNEVKELQVCSCHPHALAQ